MSTPETGSAYGAANIKVLEGLEAVRKRPGMYIGDTSERGLHHLVFEVVDNSVDEALVGHCTRIAVTIHIDSSITVDDNGRGIPVEMHEAEGVSAAQVVMTKLQAGGKFEKSAYKVSGGLHGVGVSVVNALSETLEMEVRRDGKVYFQRYHRGGPEAPIQETGVTDQRGTKITFKPDPLIFETTSFSFDILSQRLRELAFLNRGIHITIDDERDQKSHEFLYEGGIVSFVQHLNKAKTPIHPDVVYLQGARDGIEIEIALQWNEGYAENVYAFANNINTIEGGTHLVGFKSALTRTINADGVANRIVKKDDEALQGDDGREGLTAVISVKVPEPQFEGQTKTKLGNSEVKGTVEALVNDRLAIYFEEHPAEARRIMLKGLEAARVREATRKAKELARRKGALDGGGLPGKLADYQEIIERGHLFIAQPPLYRVKRGRTQQYLKDEFGLEDYLIELGAGDMTLRGQGGPAIAGTPLKQLVKKAIRLEKVLDVLERKGRNRHVVTALARQPAMDASVLTDEAGLRQVVVAAEAYLKVAAPDLVPVSFSFEQDREHACLSLIASTRTNGAEPRNLIDRELGVSPEFEELRRLARELAAAGEPPYTIGEGEAAELVPNLQQAVARVMDQARKGLEIQRYKGLGEMNASQLW